MASERGTVDVQSPAVGTTPSTDANSNLAAPNITYGTRTKGAGDLDAWTQSNQHGSWSAYKGITMEHWTPSNDQPNCMNPKCKKKFSLRERHHHCRRCGKVFCGACTSYRRRLNILAHPDPSGKLYKVCHDCVEEPQSYGQTRSLLDELQSVRWAAYQAAHAGQGTSTENPEKVTRIIRKPGVQSSREALLACERLTQGYAKFMKSQRLRRAAKSMIELVANPKWQQAPNYVYERQVPRCRECGRTFGLLVSRQHCTACGAAVCSNCTTMDLIVYVPNGEEKSCTNWAIIKIVGSPAKEPDSCIYLRVCQPCKQTLASIQVQEVQQLTAESESQDIWERLEKVYSSISTIQAKIDDQLPKYQELVDILDLEPKSSSPTPQKQSNTQILAKAQGDLSDYFTKFVMTVQDVKALKPVTNGQATILRNLIKSKYEYYQETIFAFRQSRRRLETFTPLDVLTVIQGIVDNNAINSCYVSVKQLALEVLHLSLKYKLPDTLTLTIAQLEEVVLEELQRSVKKAGEDWEEHEFYINQLLEEQIKEHRLIRLSDAGTGGCREVELQVRGRAAHILRQVELQLGLKSSDRSFSKCKEALVRTLHLLEEEPLHDWQLPPDRHSMDRWYLPSFLRS